MQEAGLGYQKPRRIAAEANVDEHDEFRDDFKNRRMDGK